jgi:hypothetical protein
MKKLIIILSLISFPANAFNATVGLSSNYLKLSDPNFEVKNEVSAPNPNVGVNHMFKNKLFVSLTTNRLFNQSSDSTVNSKKSGTRFDLETKTDVDSLVVGYPINRFIVGGFIANAGVQKKLYFQDNLVAKSEKHSIIYGLNLIYCYDKNISFNSSLIAPNKEQGLDYGISIGITYNR